MKRILMLSTGGTIASEAGEDGLVPKTTGEQMVKLIPQLAKLCEIDCKTILNLDSTNIQPEEWALMAHAAYEGVRHYDGVVITHGTDTMAYSAAAVSEMLQNSGKPVVFTGSQLPIGAPGTDAKRNIYDAFVTAVNGPAGVTIVFNGLVIEGSRASKVRTVGFDAFASINRPPVGHLREGRLVVEHPPEQAGGAPRLDDRFDPMVLLYKLIPGFEPKLLDAARDLGYHGVVIEGFGSGGVPYHQRNLLPAIERLTTAGIAVVATTQCRSDGCDLGIYDVGVKALRAGVIPAGDLPTEAVVARLMTVLGRTRSRAEIERVMRAERGPVDPLVPLCQT